MKGENLTHQVVASRAAETSSPETGVTAPVLISAASHPARVMRMQRRAGFVQESSPQLRSSSEFDNAKSIVSKQRFDPGQTDSRYLAKPKVIDGSRVEPAVDDKRSRILELSESLVLH